MAVGLVPGALVAAPAIFAAWAGTTSAAAWAIAAAWAGAAVAAALVIATASAGEAFTTALTAAAALMPGTVTKAAASELISTPAVLAAFTNAVTSRLGLAANCLVISAFNWAGVMAFVTCAWAVKTKIDIADATTSCLNMIT
jgi:phage gp37-like protein